MIPLMPFQWDWNLNVGTVLAVLVSAGGLFFGILKTFWNAHQGNVQTLSEMKINIAEIRTELKPITNWFTRHVVEKQP